MSTTSKLKASQQRGAFFMRFSTGLHLMGMKKLLLLSWIIGLSFSGISQAPYWSKSDHLASWIVADSYSYALYDTLALTLHNPYPDTLYIRSIELPGGTPVQPPHFIASGDSRTIRVAVQYYGVGEGVRVYDHRVTVRGNLYVPVVSQYVVLVNTDKVKQYTRAGGVLDSLVVEHVPKPYHLYCHDQGTLREIGQKTTDGSRKLGTWYRFKSNGDLDDKREYSRIARLHGYPESILLKENFSFRCIRCDTFSPVWDGYGAQGMLMLYVPNVPGTLRLAYDNEWAEWHLDDTRQGEVSLFKLPLHDSSTLHYRASYYTGWVIPHQEKVVVTLNPKWLPPLENTYALFYQYLERQDYSPQIFHPNLTNWYVLGKPSNLNMDDFVTQLHSDTAIGRVGWFIEEAALHGTSPLVFFGQIHLIIDPMTIPNDGIWQQALTARRIINPEMVQGTYITAQLPLQSQGFQSVLHAMEELPWVRSMELSWEGQVIEPEMEIHH